MHRLDGSNPARPMGILILDLIDADRIFEHHSVRALKIKKSRA
jgi:hypothetical protein